MEDSPNDALVAPAANPADVTSALASSAEVAAQLDRLSLDAPPVQDHLSPLPHELLAKIFGQRDIAASAVKLAGPLNKRLLPHTTAVLYNKVNLETKKQLAIWCSTVTANEELGSLVRDLTIAEGEEAADVSEDDLLDMFECLEHLKSLKIGAGPACRAFRSVELHPEACAELQHLELGFDPFETLASHLLEPLASQTALKHVSILVKDSLPDPNAHMLNDRPRWNPSDVRLPSVTSLTLGGICREDEPVGAILSMFPNITHLTLRPNFSDYRFDDLWAAAPTSITHLYIDHKGFFVGPALMPITIRAFGPSISRLSALVHVDIQATPYLDIAPFLAAHLPALRKLVLGSGTRPTFHALHHFINTSTSLRRITIDSVSVGVVGETLRVEDLPAMREAYLMRHERQMAAHRIPQAQPIPEEEGPGGWVLPSFYLGLSAVQGRELRALAVSLEVEMEGSLLEAMQNEGVLCEQMLAAQALRDGGAVAEQP